MELLKVYLTYKEVKIPLESLGGYGHRKHLDHLAEMWRHY